MAFAKVVEARNKGLSSQEKQARGLLKQTMAAGKRAEGMLMTLELAMESRDLAELNVRCLDAIGSLSQDIIGSSQQTSPSKAKKIKMDHAGDVQVISGGFFDCFRTPVSTYIAESGGSIGQQMPEKHCHTVAAVIFSCDHIRFADAVPVK